MGELESFAECHRSLPRKYSMCSHRPCTNWACATCVEITSRQDALIKLCRASYSLRTWFQRHDLKTLIRVFSVLSFVSDPGGYDEDVAIELLQDAADAGHGAATEALEQLQEDTDNDRMQIEKNTEALKTFELRNSTEDVFETQRRTWWGPQQEDLACHRKVMLFASHICTYFTTFKHMRT